MNSTHVCPKDRKPTSYIALVVDEFNASVLMKKDGNNFAFPRIDCAEMPHRGHLMSECFSQQLSRATRTPMKLVLLYSTATEIYQRHLRGIHRVIFEWLDSYDEERKSLVTPVCSAFEWVTLSDIVYTREYNFAVAEDQLGLCTAMRADDLEPSEGGIRPWQMVEWFSDTTKVATSKLHDISYNLKGEFEQYQISPVSAVLRADTNKGRVYLKASHKREGMTMRSVARFASFVVPDPLYVNVKEGWMLMNDYGQTLREKFSRKDYENVLMLHGRLQVESTKHLKELENIGIPRQGFEVIMEKARKLLVEPEIREGLEKLGSTVGSCYEKIASDFFRGLYVEAQLPRALVHNDLYDGNIIKTSDERGQGQYVIFDWGFAEIDIPFLDVLALEWEICSGESEREREREEGINSYLELWPEYGTVKELRQIMGCIGLNNMFEELLTYYEYAKENKVEPVLDDDRMKRLHRALSQMPKEIEILKRFIVLRQANEV